MNKEYDMFKFLGPLNGKIGPNPHGIGPDETVSIGEHNELIATNHTSQRTIEGWYAVSVPGTILNPSDADFSAVYATKDRQAAMRLQKP